MSLDLEIIFLVFIKNYNDLVVWFTHFSDYLQQSINYDKILLVQKWIYKHKGLIPDSMLRRASWFDLAIDKGDNSNTLVPTTAMRPDVMAKRYSRRTQELVEFDSMSS